VPARLAFPEPIDLQYLGAERCIGVYLLETDDGLALFDCGPTTSLEQLRAGLGARGVDLSDVRHLLLSHIHLDHAGAAGALVREQPALQVHVSEIGAPHLVDPAKLEASARRLYGDAFDHLWGELAAVPAENVHAVGNRVLGLDCFPSPGHASHHVCYVDPDGTVYAGDAAGVRIRPERYVAPVSPPPDVDVEGWTRTIDDPAEHLPRLRAELARWAERVRDGLDADAFSAAARADAGDAAGLYERAGPFWQSWQGLRRYWDKRAEAA
jgi:glyoxylase-like metal-dependent hydrolase (beta-lactamase superfamily II)